MTEEELKHWVEILQINLDSDDRMGEATTCSMHALGLFLKDYKQGLTSKEREDAEGVLGRSRKGLK